MIRRYVLATAAVVLLVVGLLLGLTVYLGLHYGETSDDRARIGTLAEALTPTADGLQFDPAQTPAQWMQGYAWAMVLDGNGTVIWQYDLPQNLNKRYTASEIASFSRWYLDDWPVFCWTADYGLFVAAQPRGSVWKYNIYSSAALMYAAAAGLLPTLGVLLAAVVGCCVFFSWRGARQLRAIAAGLDTIADGGTVELPITGYAGELADAVAIVATLARGAAAVPVAEQLLVAAPAVLAAGLELPPVDEPLSVGVTGALRVEDGRLSGTATDVAWAGAVRHLVVAAEGPDGEVLALVDVGDLPATDAANLAGEPRGSYVFDGQPAQVGPVGELRARYALARAVQLAAAAETVLAGAGALKSTVGAVGLAAVLAICLVPFFRLAVHYLTYKAAAALAGMVCDLRLCKLIDDIGSAFGMMLGITGACALVLLVSLISAISAAVP